MLLSTTSLHDSESAIRSTVLQPVRGVPVGRKRLYRRICLSSNQRFFVYRNRPFQRNDFYDRGCPRRPSGLSQSIAGALVSGRRSDRGNFAAPVLQSVGLGKNGIGGPISAVLGAALPTIFSIATEGFPGIGHIFGFVLAGIGVWLISRAEDGGARPEGLGLAVLAGIGFAGFYICIRQAGEGSAVWTATIARAASFLVTSTIVLLGRQWQRVATPIAGLAAMVGLFDVSGSMAFIRASQAGRLDEAVVLSSLYPVVTVLLARVLLHEHFTRWKLVGMVAALVAVPIIAG